MSAVSIPAAAPPASRARSRPLAAIASGCGVAGAVAVAVVSAHHAFPSEVSPVVPHGAWNDAWIGSLIAAFVLYGLGTALARRGRLRLRLALGIAVAVQVLPLAAPLLLSKDVYAYWSEARVLTTRHANPYRSAPADFPRDPSFRWVSESWRAEHSAYGPAWEVAATVPAVAAGASHRRAELSYRLFAVLALLASVVVVASRTRSSVSVVFFGWSPLLALHFGGGGHGDALMMLVVLGALVAGVSARGGALWPLASAFKPVPPLLVPLQLAERRLAMGRRWWVGLAGSTIATVVLWMGLFSTQWIHVTTGVHQASPLGLVHWLVQLGLQHRIAVVVGALLFFGIYVVLLREAWQHGRARYSIAATALCLTSSLLRPWYAIWPLALAALDEEDVLGMVLAYALSAYLLFGDAVHL